MSAGSVILEFIAKTGIFETDVERAEKKVKKFSKTTKDEVKSLADLARVAFTFEVAVKGFELIKQAKEAFDNLIESAAKFQDISEETGASAEGLASLAVASAVAGVSVEDLAKGMNKLTVNLSETSDEGTKAGAALKALGVPLDEFKKLSPDEQIVKLTEAFGSFADGSEKTAVAMALFGKGGAQFLKVFKEIEAEGGRNKILTDEQIKQADEYADKQKKLTTELGLYAAAIVTQALPALGDLIGSFVDLAKEIFDIDSATNKIKDNKDFALWADDAVYAIAFVIDAIRDFGAVTKTVFAAAAYNFKLLFQVRDLDDLKKAFGEYNRIVNTEFATPQLRDKLTERKALREQAATIDFGTGGDWDTKKKLNIDGLNTAKAGDAEAAARKRIENEIKGIESALKDQLAAFDSQSKEFDRLYSHNKQSIDDYYDSIAMIRSLAFGEEQKAIQKEISLLKSSRSKQKDASKREEITGQITEKTERLAKLERDAAEKQREDSQKREDDYKKYLDQLDELNAKLLDLKGNTAEAATIRFDKQNRDLRDRLTAQGNGKGLDQLSELERQNTLSEEYKQIVKTTEPALNDLSRTEAMLSAQRSAGNVSTIDGLIKEGELRKEKIAIMEQEVVALEAIAKASENSDLIEQSKSARDALEQLKLTADPLGDKFKNMFQQGFEGFFNDILSGTKSASDAFKSMAASILTEISKLLVNKAVTQLLSGADFGSLTSLFSSGSASSGAASSGYVTQVGTAGYADGGDPPVGQLSLVGERGPELFVPRVAGTIIPNHDLGNLFKSLGVRNFAGARAVGGPVNAGSSYLTGERGPEAFRPRTSNILPRSANQNHNKTISVVNNITVPGGTSKQTADQIAADISRKLAIANARNN